MPTLQVFIQRRNKKTGELLVSFNSRKYRKLPKNQLFVYKEEENNVVEEWKITK